MNIKVIVNPRAGCGTGKFVGLKTEQCLCDRGIQYSLDLTFKPGGAVSLSKKAVDDGFDMIIGVGGDGTLNEIANGICGSGTVLAAIPAGTRNNLCRSLGIPLSDIAEAVEIALHGTQLLADTGKIGNRYFLNDAEVIPAPPDKYAGLFLRADDVELNANFVFAAVSNGRFFSAGSEISPRAGLDDGYFNISVMNRAPGSPFWRYGAGVKSPGRGNYPLTTFKAKKIFLQSSSELEIRCDGELLEIPSPYEITVSECKIPVKTK